MPQSNRSWTIAGLLIALFGLPAIVAAYNWQIASPSDATIALREVAILSLTALLLWIVIRKEQLPLASIGLRFDSPGRSLLWGLGLTVALFATVIALLSVYDAMGIHYGEGQRVAPSIAVTLLTVLRAGISEEIFYRGFGVERLQSLTGSKWIAAAVVVLCFAAFHYRQGVPGVVLALALGAVLTAFYLWKRDLLAAIIAHFLVDFIPNVALPLLGASD
jgi:membrane protease YdiL (CAAX protease family)